MPALMIAPCLNRRAGEEAAGLRRVNALARRALLEQAMNHVDLVLQRLERLQRLAELHLGARALGAPVILVDAVPHEDDAESLRESCPRWLPPQSTAATRARAEPW